MGISDDALAQCVAQRQGFKALSDGSLIPFRMIHQGEQLSCAKSFKTGCHWAARPAILNGRRPHASEGTWTLDTLEVHRPKHNYRCTSHCDISLASHDDQQVSTSRVSHAETGRHGSTVPSMVENPSSGSATGAVERYVPFTHQFDVRPVVSAVLQAVPAEQQAALDGKLAALLGYIEEQLKHSLFPEERWQDFGGSATTEDGLADHSSDLPLLAQRKHWVLHKDAFIAAVRALVRCFRIAVVSRVRLPDCTHIDERCFAPPAPGAAVPVPILYFMAEMALSVPHPLRPGSFDILYFAIKEDEHGEDVLKAKDRIDWEECC